jgi:hypothetical protein
MPSYSVHRNEFVHERTCSEPCFAGFGSLVTEVSVCWHSPVEIYNPGKDLVSAHYVGL